MSSICRAKVEKKDITLKINGHTMIHYQETWFHMIQNIKGKQSSYCDMKKCNHLQYWALSQAQSKSRTMNARWLHAPSRKEVIIGNELIELPRCGVRTNITRAGVNVRTSHNCSWRQRFTGVDDGLRLHLAVSQHASFIRFQEQLRARNMQTKMKPHNSD